MSVWPDARLTLAFDIAFLEFALYLERCHLRSPGRFGGELGATQGAMWSRQGDLHSPRAAGLGGAVPEWFRGYDSVPDYRTSWPWWVLDWPTWKARDRFLNSCPLAVASSVPLGRSSVHSTY
ncbi:hypothetical protein AVEN_237979-1 [Araneus ventricosus]|uniref:Uncharacterized protein n=1 Tax=Araneus ventricosus TaxID=182803 RepID=A0A4Y2G4M1_ARAVE|nr:hypothetical protein AVEN_237979-1 [Araneus ventricosus]